MKSLILFSCVVSLMVLAGIAWPVRAADNPSNDACNVPGTAAQWLAAYCMQQAQTENADSPAVQKCLITAIKDPAAAKMSACEQKLYRKKQICESYTKDPVQREKCTHDPKFSPLVTQQQEFMD